MADRAVIGVLSLQGDFADHARMLERLGAESRLVRVPTDLEGLDGLVIPGGESTTMTLGIEREGLAEPLRELVGAGIPVLGTCAGLIMLDRDHLGLLDVTSRRNAFGRQTQSFEARLTLAGMSERPLDSVFIRAPWVEDHGDDVEVLAEVGGHPVAVRQGNMLAVSFHPEIAGEDRLHAWLVGAAAAARGRNGGPARPGHGDPAPQHRSAGDAQLASHDGPTRQDETGREETP